MAAQIPRPIRDVVRRRSGDMCELCGLRQAGHMHHRRPRKAGGSKRASTNTPANLLHLCPRCHDDIERHGRGRALANGWLIRDAIEAPPDMPALLATAHGSQLTWLFDDGTTALVDVIGAVVEELGHCHQRKDDSA